MSRRIETGRHDRSRSNSHSYERYPRTYDDRQDDPDRTGRFRPVNSRSSYDYDDEYDDEPMVSRHSDYGTQRRLPLWLIVAAAGLIVVFIVIGVVAFHGSGKSDTATTDTTNSQEAALRMAQSEAAKTVASMTLEEKVAQMFIVTPEQFTDVETVTQAGSATQAQLASYPVGGIVYSSANIESESQLKTLLTNTASYSKYPIFLAVDEEGGDASVIAGSGLVSVASVDSPGTIGAVGDSSAAYTSGNTIGGYLKALGFNLDLAPDADILSSTNATVGDRSFGSDPTLTSSMVSQFVTGMQDSGVSACAKSFPGQAGITDTDETGVPVSSRAMADLQTTEFLPFIAAIDSNVDLIMVGDVKLTQATSDGQAAMFSSQVITDTLRGQLGYDGVVISEPMNTAAVTDNYTSGQAAIAFIQAGGDVIYMPADFYAAYQDVLDAIADGQISQDRIDASATRILTAKYLRQG